MITQSDIIDWQNAGVVGSGVTGPAGSTGATGATGATGPTGPQGVAAISSFVSKTAAYTLTTADSGKYLIASGGSWTLTLPTASAGLTYPVRNDMGISGTTGTITIATVGGATIDGASSISLLAQQEILITSDGTNWRTLGRQREVVIGTQDVSSVASASFLLPTGYRYYKLEFTDLVAAASGNPALEAQVSIDGGSTWYSSSNYQTQFITNNSTTAVAAQAYTQGFWYISNSIWNTQAPPSILDITFHPGSSSTVPSFVCTASGAVSSFNQLATIMGVLSVAIGQVNAIKYNMSSGNIATSQLTVIGVV